MHTKHVNIMIINLLIFWKIHDLARLNTMYDIYRERFTAIKDTHMTLYI